MIRIVLILLVCACFTSSASGQNGTEKTWTFTYLKAKEDQQDNLKEFLLKNWFVMDSIAVERGLFNDYQLLENVSKAATSTEWDYIVAVEYFTRGTFEDIQDQWITIRKEHTKVLVDGLDFADLGTVVKSEEIAISK